MPGTPTSRRAADGPSSLRRRQAHAFRRRQAEGSELGTDAADHDDRLFRHRHALFSGERTSPALGPQADGPFNPGADRALVRCFDRRSGLDEPCLSGLWLRPAAADRGGRGGACGPGRPALDRDRTAGAAAVGADEDFAGAGAGALSSRQEHRGSLQARAAGHRPWHDRHSGGLRGAAAEPGYHYDHRQGRLFDADLCWFFLVVVQPNLGTTLIIVMDGCSMLFLAGLSWWGIAPTLGAVAAAVPLAWRFVLHDFQKARVETFLDPESDALGKGWNITQAKIAIGSGGVGGLGFLQGTQSRLNFLPESQTDFIWTSFCEEFGFVGALARLVLFAVVIFYGVQTAMSARSQFGRLLAMGVILNFFFYIMVNGLMVLGLFLVVGFLLLLLFFGGFALLLVLFGFGLLMSLHILCQVEGPRRAGGGGGV